MKQSQRSADIVSLARAGIPYTTIGERYGVSRQAIGQMAKRNGISRAPAKGWAHLKDPKERATKLRLQAEQSAARTTELLAKATLVEAGR